MQNLKGTTQEYLIKSYYNFIGKLYGLNNVERDFEFEKRVADKFGGNPEKDIDIEIAFGIKTKSGKSKIRKERSIVQFVENNTGIIPDDTSHIKFYGEFVERNENQEKVRGENKKDRFAFQEQIRVVKNLENKNLSRKNTDTKYFEKEDLESFSEIIKYKNHELGL